MGTVQLVRSPQEWGGLWKRERERKPLGGERISIVRCALSPLKEVVARTPVDGSCVTHPVKQIESHASPQDIGKTVLRVPSTQSIKSNTKESGHQNQKMQSKTQKTGRCRNGILARQCLLSALAVCATLPPRPAFDRSGTAA